MDLELKNATKKYDDDIVVNDLSLTIKTKTTFGLLGPNGAGKSTIIKILIGLTDLNSGEICFSNYSFKKDINIIKRLIGVVPQNRNLIFDQSVYENLYFQGMLYGVKSEKLKNRISYLIDYFNLTDKKKSLVSTLSGGNQQKVLILRALIHDPEFLIMDEPTVGLDPHSRRDIWKLIERLKTKYTILLATQYMDEADTLCDEVGILNNGGLIKQGTPTALKKSFSEREYGTIFEIKTNDISQNKQILDLVKQLSTDISLSFKESGDSIIIYASISYFTIIVQQILNYKIKMIHIHEATLEDVFIHLTGKKIMEVQL
ncbi:MAG: ABC transporter ATP-binding protein [Bacteroidales bacterium]|jgi:ABC-type multidrug transport system ATPase subunit|nr:ABC transporter ATP-binding protein [Bacteroidales bacterium]